MYLFLAGLKLRVGYVFLIVFSCMVVKNPGWSEEKVTVDLNRGIALALDKNEEMLIRRTEKDQAVQQVREMRSAGLPRVDASINYNRNWLLPSLVFAGNSIKIGSENNITGNINLSQTLYSGGRISASKDVARQNVIVVDEGMRLSRQMVIAQVETGFYDVLVAQELLEVAAKALDTARANLRQVQARRRVGRVSEYDELSAKVQVSSLRADSIRAFNDYRLSKMVFKDVIGLELSAEVEVKGELSRQTALKLTNIKPLVEMALTKRPEMNQAGHLVAIQDRTMDVEKAGLRPTIELTATGQSQFQSEKLDVGDREWQKSWGTGVVVRVPLFDGQRSRSRVAQVRAETERAKLQREQQKRRVRLEVEQAWLNWNEVVARIGAQEDAVDQATKGLQVAESLYRSGAGTQLEILNAQLALTEARTGLALAKRELAINVMQIELAIGILGEK